MTETPEYASLALFLGDGITATASPAALLIGNTSEQCVETALLMHDNGMLGAVAGSGIHRLRPEVLGDLDPPTADHVLSQFVTAGAWVYCADLDTYLDSPGGRAMLSALCRRLSRGDLPGVLAGVTPIGAKRLTAEAVRMLGLMLTLDLTVEPRQSARSLDFITAVIPGISVKDRGWLVQVRCDLDSDVLASPQVGEDQDTQDAVRLVDQLYATGSIERPTGVQVSFEAQAFTGTQNKAAFHAAELVARRVIGRPLQSNEVVKATRGVCYA